MSHLIVRIDYIKIMQGIKTMKWLCKRYDKEEIFKPDFLTEIHKQILNISEEMDEAYLRRKLK